MKISVLSLLKYSCTFLFFTIHFKLYALPWHQYEFKKMNDQQILNCLYNIDQNGKKSSQIQLPDILFDCIHDSDNDQSDKEDSFVIVNKNKEYFYLDKPVSAAKLKEATGEDFSNAGWRLGRPKFILQNGDRYALLCFYTSPSGHDLCEINFYVDLEDGRVTLPDFPDMDDGKSFINSKYGYIYEFSVNYRSKKSELVIRKMFSKSDKNITIPFNNFLIRYANFLSENKIQVVGKQNHRKIIKIVDIDSKNLEN